MCDEKKEEKFYTVLGLILIVLLIYIINSISIPISRKYPCEGINEEVVVIYSKK